MNGPKSSRATGSSEKETTVVVRPWKFPPATTIRAAPGRTPFTRYPQARATFTADSTASAPVFIGRTASVPVSAARSRWNAGSRSLWNARAVRVSVSSWACAAAVSAGWRCPKLSAE